MRSELVVIQSVNRIIECCCPLLNLTPRNQRSNMVRELISVFDVIEIMSINDLPDTPLRDIITNELNQQNRLTLLNHFESCSSPSNQEL